MSRKPVLAVTLFAAVLGFSTTASADGGPCDGGPGTCIKIGTLAPKQSLWGTVFQAWAKGVKEESKNDLELQFFYNGTQGDEAAMVAKMRNKQLDAAAITARGMAFIWPHILAFQLPGVFTNWEKLDKARNALLPELQAEFEKKGFRLVGNGDVGVAHMMSKGGPIKVPADLKNQKCSYITGDNVGSTFLRVVGVSGTALEVPSILPAIKNGTVTVLNAPALAAEQLQWAPEMEHINTMPTGIGIGGLVFFTGPESKYNNLSEPQREILKRTGKNAGDILTGRIRNADKASFERASQKMTPYNPSDAEKAKWNEVFAQVYSQVCGSALDAGFCGRVKAAAQ